MNPILKMQMDFIFVNKSTVPNYTWIKIAQACWRLVGCIDEEEIQMMCYILFKAEHCVSAFCLLSSLKGTFFDNFFSKLPFPP